MGVRITGSATFAPTQVTGTGLARSDTTAEHDAVLANLQADPGYYTVTSSHRNQRRINFTYAYTPTIPIPASCYEAALAALQARPAYLISSINVATLTITYTYDSNLGAL